MLPSGAMKPPEIFDELKSHVIGQPKAVQSVAVALYKHLIGHKTGNILMIGGSGTGKTTIMRAVEGLLSENSAFAEYGTVVRINANLLADLASRGKQSSAVLEKLAQAALARYGDDTSHEQIVQCVSHGIVFVDEIDKIRTQVGDKPNVNGIIAQESLLTLMESETQAIPIPVKGSDGHWTTIQTPIDTGGILFIAGGAFEELYDAVFDRVTAGGKNPPWRLVSKADGSIERQIVFQMGDHLLHTDLFDYGITPQFIARFDSIVTLRNLNAKDLVTIFTEIPGAILPITQEYFDSYGVALVVSEDALFYIADKATENSRLGARALKEVFGRVVGHYEYDPWASGHVTKRADGGEELVIDLERAKSVFST